MIKKYLDSIEVAMGNTCLSVRIPLFIPLDYIGFDKPFNWCENVANIPEEQLIQFLQNSSDRGGQYIKKNQQFGKLSMDSVTVPSKAKGRKIYFEPWILIKQGGTYIKDFFKPTIETCMKSGGESMFGSAVEQLLYSGKRLINNISLAGNNLTGPNYEYYYKTFEVSGLGIKEFLGHVKGIGIIKDFVDDFYDNYGQSRFNLLEMSYDNL